MSDAVETLGTIIGDGHGRDAVHVAVIPAIAGERLNPGDHVGIFHEMDMTVLKFRKDGFPEKAIGVVDPFLADTVKEGERFWLFIYPRKITGLRHVWTHPDFPDEGSFKPYVQCSREESESWLCSWWQGKDLPDFDDMIAAASGEEKPGMEYELVEGEWITFVGQNAHCDVPSEFWDHLENVKGRKLKRVPYFSCTC